MGENYVQNNYYWTSSVGFAEFWVTPGANIVEIFTCPPACNKQREDRAVVAVSTLPYALHAVLNPLNGMGPPG